MPMPSSYEELMDWTASLDDNPLAAECASATIRDLVIAFEDQLDDIQRACVESARRNPGGLAAPSIDREAWDALFHRMLRGPAAVDGHFSARKARDYLVYNLCPRGPVDGIAGEYLVSWAEDAGIPFPIALAAFARHIPGLD